MFRSVVLAFHLSVTVGADGGRGSEEFSGLFFVRRRVDACVCVEWWSLWNFAVEWGEHEGLT